jgi:hypothetical protein
MHVMHDPFLLYNHEQWAVYSYYRPLYRSMGHGGSYDRYEYAYGPVQL